MIKELDYPSYANMGGFQRVSWGAVFAGAVVSLAVLVTLTALGEGLGLVAGPAFGKIATSFGMGSALWMLLAGAAAFYAGGWIAGRLTGIARVSESVIHGVVAWSTATVMLAFLFTSGGLGWVSRAIGATLNMNEPVVGSLITDQAIAATVEGETGIAGRFAFVMLAVDAAAAAYGARAGTRVMRPVPMSEVRRERVGI
jgi:hypothetical protein